MLKRLFKIEDYPSRWLRTYLKCQGEAALVVLTVAVDVEAELMRIEREQRGERL